jgi:hypothetical protein
VRCALILILSTSTAAASPIATLAKDVDGDGSDDKVELDASGELRIETKKGTGKVALPFKATRATLSGAVAAGVPSIVVQTIEDAYVTQYQGGKWKLAISSTIGPVGLDGDYAVAVEVTAAGVYRYQTRAGYRRCDGNPALLFAERLDGGRFQAAATLPTFMPSTAATVTARAENLTAMQPPVNYQARFGSYQSGAPDAGALAIPRELDDGNAMTSWREELSGTGEGHFFTYVPRVPSAKASEIRFIPAKTRGSTRPQRIGVVGAQGAFHVEFPDTTIKNPIYIAALPAPIGGCVTIVIESAASAGATSIGELQVWSENEFTALGQPSYAMLVDAIADATASARSATQELARRGASGVKAIEDGLAQRTQVEQRTRLVRALLENTDPSRGPILARVVGEDWLRDKDLVEAIKALRGLAQAQALHDLAARQAIDLEARVAAVRALQPSVDAERDFLVALAGRGPRELRQAVIETLTDVPIATLAPLAEAQGKAAAAGDIYRAITRRAHAKPDERAPALAALTAGLAKANDYERRYRIVDGIAAVGDAAALKSLAQLFERWPANQETAAIKQIAARAIAVNPRADALETISALVVDGDPGVRLAALSAIAGVTSGNAGAWHGPAGADDIDRVIQTRLATDTWPEVRRYAAQTLGTRCSRPGPAASLADAIARDPDVGVRGDALGALVECKSTTAPGLLAKLWDDGKAPLELRQRAVDLTVVLADKALAAKLVAKFKQWRRAALDSEPALRLAQNAAYAIGRLRAPGAPAALESALDDSAFPELVAAAATGLGLLGETCPATARPKLKALTHSDEQQIEIAATRALAVCGK